MSQRAAQLWDRAILYLPQEEDQTSSKAREEIGNLQENQIVIIRTQAVPRQCTP